MQARKEGAQASPSAGKPRPLLGVVAVVDVFIDDREIDASEAIRSKLASLGATLLHRFSPKVTHVVWKDGKNTKMLKKVFNHGDPLAFLVSPLWVQECFEADARADETAFLLEIDPLKSFLKPKTRRSIGTPTSKSLLKPRQKEGGPLKQEPAKKKTKVSPTQENKTANSTVPESSVPPETSAVLTVGCSGVSEALRSMLQTMLANQASYEWSDCPSILVIERRSRTLKVLSAIARGSWVVDSKWLTNASKSRSFDVELEPFETIHFEAARTSRIKHQKKQYKGLLHGKRVYVSKQPTSGPSREEICEVILFAGGDVVVSIKDADLCITSEEFLDHERIDNMPPLLLPEWLYDSIEQYTLLEQTPYQLDIDINAAEEADEGSTDV